jgi:maltokinase
VADVHGVLREYFPTGSVDASAVAGRMHERLQEMRTQVPELEPYVASVGAVFDRLSDLGTEPVQRVHGDLHLGQTLRTVIGWKLVDFEGEPAKQLAERVLPDSPWRDVAGMLRSFDYAARSVEQDFLSVVGDTADQIAFRAGEWAHRNRQAFLSGYLGGRALTAEEHTMVTAYEADKAVYEVGYEARNRPTWIQIPLAALAKIDDQVHEATAEETP